MTDFTILNYPSILGDGQMTKKCPKFIYEYREQIPIPPVFASLWGDIAHFAHIGGILAHFAIHNGQKMGG